MKKYVSTDLKTTQSHSIGMHVCCFCWLLFKCEGQLIINVSFLSTRYHQYNHETITSYDIDRLDFCWLCFYISRSHNECHMSTRKWRNLCTFHYFRKMLISNSAVYAPKKEINIVEIFISASKCWTQKYSLKTSWKTI